MSSALARSTSTGSEQGVFAGDDFAFAEEQGGTEAPMTEDGLRALAVALEAEEEEEERKRRMRELIETKNKLSKERAAAQLAASPVVGSVGSLPKRLSGSQADKLLMSNPISGSLERSVGEAMGYYKTSQPLPVSQIDFKSPPLSASAQAASILAAAAATGSSLPKPVPLGSLPERYTVMGAASLSKREEAGGFYTSQKPLSANQIAAASPISFSAQTVVAPVTKPKISLLSAAAAESNSD
jgi:hypothetical protein